MRNRKGIVLQKMHAVHLYIPYRPYSLPQGLSKRRFIEYYARRFGTAEINNSLYQLPSTETLIKHRGMAPEGFLFAVKASRDITRMKKLKHPKKPF
jgi:uncharacterized protein YecE (DUF72 family)